jgi:23S rRNA G2445 N2-methylase RlmL
MANLKAAEKNSKIAGMNKKIKFSRTMIEDLDLKFNLEVDKIIVQLPAVGKETEKRVLNLYRDFFEICKKILKKEGKIACVGLNIELSAKIAEDNEYEIEHERKIMQGKEELDFYIFSAKK